MKDEEDVALSEELDFVENYLALKQAAAVLKFSEVCSFDLDK